MKSIRSGSAPLASLAFVASCFGNPPTVGDASSGTGQPPATTSTTVSGPGTAPPPSTSAGEVGPPMSEGGSSGQVSDTTGPSLLTTGGASSPGGSSGPGGCTRSLYLNFDGATLNLDSVDDAPMNTTSLGLLVGDWPPYGGGDIDEVLNAVADRLAPFNICIDTLPPLAEDYDMVVVTDGVLSGGVIGLAGLDCLDSAGVGGVGVVFAGVGGLNAEIIANVSAREFALTLGLEQVDSMGGNELMGNGGVSATQDFLDECFATLNGSCPASGECPGGDQNSALKLMGILGPA